MTGLYLHIPFCNARCGYCDFVTFTGKDAYRDGYVAALCREIELYADSTEISTVFFGGGTPSLLSADQVSRVLDAVCRRFVLRADAEITLEANPESLTLDKARGWRAAGVNRLSIGLQAMADRLLNAMDRLHNVNEFLSAYGAARTAGFVNVNVDLMYGFPEQSLDDWRDTLEKTLALAPEHLSLYALGIEAHTPFAARGVRVDTDMQSDMYVYARGCLPSAGYAQYEISNFSRAGSECRHNLIYWRQQDYLGLGVGAVGCVGALRWQNEKSLEGYLAAVREGKRPRASEESLDGKTRRFERLMLGLRLREGLAWDSAWDADWKSRRADLVSRNLLEECSPGRWRVPDHAVALTNQVLLPFLS